MRLLLPIFILALACGGCVAPARKYSAPDFRKVDAASVRQDTAHRKLNATAVRAEVKLSAAQKNADTIAAHSATIIGLVDQLARLAPPELAPRFSELKTAVQAEQSETGDLVTNLLGAQSAVDQLKMKDLPEAAAAKAESDGAISAVKVETQKTADAATSESARRYKAESQLFSQKIFKWVLRIGVAAIVVVISVLFIAGKLSIAGIRGWFRI